MVELLKELSEAAQSDASVNLPSLAQFVRTGRTNTQEQQQERLLDAHRIFDLQVCCCALSLPEHQRTAVTAVIQQCLQADTALTWFSASSSANCPGWVI